MNHTSVCPMARGEGSCNCGVERPFKIMHFGDNHRVYEASFSDENGTDSKDVHRAQWTSLMRDLATALHVGANSFFNGSIYHDYCAFFLAGAGPGPGINSEEFMAVQEILEKWGQRFRWFNISFSWNNGTPKNHNIWTVTVAHYRRQHITST